LLRELLQQVAIAVVPAVLVGPGLTAFSWTPLGAF
jgi:hypothetical protein